MFDNQNLNKQKKKKMSAEAINHIQRLCYVAKTKLASSHTDKLDSTFQN